jgi:hypothetical protein
MQQCVETGFRVAVFDVQQRHHTCYVQCTVPAIKAALCIEIN